MNIKDVNVYFNNHEKIDTYFQVELVSIIDHYTYNKQQYYSDLIFRSKDLKKKPIGYQTFFAGRSTLSVAIDLVNPFYSKDP